MASYNIPNAPQHVPAVREARFWMSAPAVVVPADAPLSEALALMNAHNVRRLPVVDDSNALCGMITQGDIRGADVLRTAGVDMLAVANALRSVLVQQVMARHPRAITATTDIREAALLMVENKIGGLPVVTADQTVVGIITESDLFEALVEQLDKRYEGA
jgi:CBS domain-containing protein